MSMNNSYDRNARVGIAGSAPNMQNFSGKETDK